KTKTEAIKQKVTNQVIEHQRKRKKEITNQKRNLSQNPNESFQSSNSFEMDTSVHSLTDENDPEIIIEKVFRYESRNLTSYCNPQKLKKEIDKNINFPKAEIKNAFVNNKNKQLYLIISDKNTIKHLNNYVWPDKAFSGGISKVEPKEKSTFIAIRRVHTTIDANDDDFKTEMSERYHLVSIKRLTKKSENNKPLPLIKAQVNNKESVEKLLKEGIRICYTSETEKLIEKLENVPLRTNYAQDTNVVASNTTKASTSKNETTTENRANTQKQYSTVTAHSANTSTTELKRLISKLIANITYISTLDFLDTSSLEMINNAIESLIKKINAY
ncbi:hypothetical protein BpHYR1_003953, partial [Brachionus plicatilis]